MENEPAIDGVKKTPDMEGAVKKLECVRASILVITVVEVAGIFGCAENRGRDSEQVQDMSHKTIEQVQGDHTDEWMAIDGVEGVAIGLFKDKPCIKIFSSRKPQELRDVIPSNVEGYPIIIEKSGPFRALDQ